MFQPLDEDRPEIPASPIPLGGAVSDAELVERMSQGDTWAVEALYRKYVPSVWALSLRLMGNRPDAEDLVQDTFAEAIRDFHELRSPSAVRSWLFGIAVHQAHRRFRRRKVLSALGLDRSPEYGLVELASHEASPDMVLDVRRIDEVLRRLSPRHRIAWLLRYVEGCSLPEVAEYCRCSLATAKRRIAAAHHEVRRRVGLEEGLWEMADE